MTDTNKKILELINENRSMKEIAKLINISEKQLFVRIKQIINNGYQLVPNYSNNSEIYYRVVYRDIVKNNKINIAMPKAKNFRCLIYSDLHVGNRNSDIKLLNYLYEYASKNGINYILNCGDIIEGDYTTDKKSIKSFEDQTETFLKKHPYDRNINEILILGNHDHYHFKNNGYDVSEKIKNSRYDIVPIGYGQGNVNLRNDSLILFHKLAEDSKPVIQSNEKIILSGHGHMMKTKLKDQLWLCIPTLSYVSTDKTKDIVPGFVDLSIDFEKGKFEYIEAKHLILNPNIILVSESRSRVKRLEMNKEN